MFCTQCGAKNDDAAGFCTQCGTTLQAAPAASSAQPSPPAPKPQPPAPPPAEAPYVAPAAYPSSPPTYVPSETQFGMPVQNVPNYMAQAVLLTLCCCPPFGIVAIVFASQVNSKLAQGNLTGALAASTNARLWSWIALAAGVFFYLCMFGLRGCHHAVR